MLLNRINIITSLGCLLALGFGACSTGQNLSPDSGPVTGEGGKGAGGQSGTGGALDARPDLSDAPIVVDAGMGGRTGTGGTTGAAGGDGGATSGSGGATGPEGTGGVGIGGSGAGGKTGTAGTGGTTGVGGTTGTGGKIGTGGMTGAGGMGIGGSCGGNQRLCTGTNTCISNAAGSCCTVADCTNIPTGAVAACNGSVCSYPCNTPNFRLCGTTCIRAAPVACCPSSATNECSGNTPVCASNNVCVGQPAGQSCTAASAVQCASGFCVDSHCCTYSSCGICQTCGADGNCDAVVNGQDDTCTLAAGKKCDGTGTCVNRMMEYSSSTPGHNDGAYPGSIASGPDGALWYPATGEVDTTANVMARIDTTGHVTMIAHAGLYDSGQPGPTILGSDNDIWISNGLIKFNVTTMVFTRITGPVNNEALGLVSLPDGHIWYAAPGQFDGSNEMGWVSTDGSTHQAYTPPIADMFQGIVADGTTLWFVGSNYVGHMSSTAPAGTVPTAFALSGVGNMTSVVKGPDGFLWATDHDNQQIVKISTAGALVATYPMTSLTAYPVMLINGPDGAMWIAQSQTDSLARLTTDGTITYIPVPTSNSGIMSLAIGPDGYLWFNEYYAGQIGRYITQ